MNRLNFEASGTVGAVLWAGIILSAGHLFGNIPFIKDNLSLILVGGIVLGLAPFVIGYIVKKWRQHPDPKTDLDLHEQNANLLSDTSAF